MTKCYEFYCWAKSGAENLDVCIKSAKARCQIEAYMDLLRQKYGVLFDDSAEDKERFFKAQKEFPEYKTYRENSVNTENYIQESYKNPKFHDKEKYKRVQILIDRDLCDFVDDFHNFYQFFSYNEYLSEFLERKLRELQAEFKRQWERDHKAVLT